VVELQGKAIKLRETITSLWDRLDIAQEERDSFNKDTTGYTTTTIAKVSSKIIFIQCHTYYCAIYIQLETEMERLHEMKKENMAKFVQATRDELRKIWDNCFYGDEQRREFAPALSDDYTDDLLSAHESELDRMRGFYKDNEDVYKLVQKRENLWKKFIELEVRFTYM
jgi:protein regulator of cytokinesis 1